MSETRKKQEAIGPVLHKTEPVSGFAAALQHLHALGHPLHIVTARPEFTRPWVYDWLGRYGITAGSGETDVIAVIWFTSVFAGMNETKAESTEEGEEKSEAQLKEAYKQSIGEGKGGKKKLKVRPPTSHLRHIDTDSQILQSIGASLFIDDHYGNLEPAIQAIPQIPCLLFGKYGWNAYHSGAETPAELLSYDERTEQGLELPKRNIEMVAGLKRVDGWNEVVKWVEAWDQGAVKSTKA
jgi:hypothetical protein